MNYFCYKYTKYLNRPQINIIMYKEEFYLKALVEINDDYYDEKQWLIKHFDLYKQTLNWPDGLPPIGRSNLTKGTLREKFHSTYKSLLYEFEHEFDNNKKTLEIMERIDDEYE